MKWERILLFALIVVVVLLLIDKFNMPLTGIANAQLSFSADESVSIPIIRSKEISSEAIYTNEIYVLGYNTLKLHEEVINVLIRKGLLTNTDANQILEKCRRKTGTEGEENE